MGKITSTLFFWKLSKLGNRKSKLYLDLVVKGISGTSMTMAIARPNMGREISLSSKNS